MWSGSEINDIADHDSNGDEKLIKRDHHSSTIRWCDFCDIQRRSNCGDTNTNSNEQSRHCERFRAIRRCTCECTNDKDCASQHICRTPAKSARVPTRTERAKKASNQHGACNNFLTLVGQRKVFSKKQERSTNHANVITKQQSAACGHDCDQHDICVFAHT